MRVLILLALLCSACGSSSPTAPSTPIVPIVPTLSTITGHVTATNGGQPLGGLSASLGTSTTTTDGAGTFAAQTSPTAALVLRLTGSSIVPRTITLAASVSRDLAVTAIALGGGFDLPFYQAFVRNGFEQPAQLQPLRRWTQNPSIYLRTVDDAGTVLDALTLNATDAAIREAVPLWTAGQFAGVVERGSGTKDGVPGWITVHWQSVHNVAFAPGAECGDAFVGANPGTVNFKYAGVCRCPGVSEIRPRTVRHELGHALGYWHTGNATDLMSGLGVNECDRQPSARERAHAAIAYARPVGNVDPDSDPTSTVTLAPLRVR